MQETVMQMPQLLENKYSDQWSGVHERDTGAGALVDGSDAPR